MTTMIVHKTKGRVDCVASIMHDIKNTPWLNGDYYKKYEGELLSYYMLIAKDKDVNARLAMDLISMQIKLAEARGKEMWVTFECTNISAEYIPRMVGIVVNSSGTLNIKINQTAKYPVRMFSI
jgi:hypothetical protein